MKENKLLLISDYDGTITKRDLKRIKKFRKKHLFAIATGRYFEAIYKELIKYKIDVDYLICNNGAEIYDGEYNLLYYQTLDENDVLAIKKLNLKKIKYNFDKDKKHLISINIYDDINIKLNNSQIEKKINKIKILPKNVNKTMAIDFLIKKYNFKNIITIGNDVNDYEMLIKYNGYKIKNSNLDIQKEVKSLRKLLKKLTN